MKNSGKLDITAERNVSPRKGIETLQASIQETQMTNSPFRLGSVRGKFERAGLNGFG